MDVKVYHKSKQPQGKNRCDGNSCSHMCLLANRNGRPSATCVCPRGMTKDTDTSCGGEYKPRTPKPRPTIPTKKKTQSTRTTLSTPHGQSSSVSSSGSLSTGAIVGILLSLLLVTIAVLGYLWYRKNHRGKTNVKYYKDMSKKPLEDDFDIAADDMDDMASIQADRYGGDSFSGSFGDDPYRPVET